MLQIAAIPADVFSDPMQKSETLLFLLLLSKILDILVKIRKFFCVLQILSVL